MNIPKEVLFENNGSKNLLVSFGGVRQGLGMPVFEFYNSLKDINCDKCFLKDNNQAWYFNGIGNELNSISEILKYLEELIAKQHYESVCFLGNSMGGYAAILFGVLLDADKIITFSPQTFINKWHRLRYNDSRWKYKIKNVYKTQSAYSKYFNLKKLLNDYKNYNGTISIYYSKNDTLDRIHAERLKAFNFIRLYPHLSGNHNLVRTLKQSGELSQISMELFK